MDKAAELGYRVAAAPKAAKLPASVRFIIYTNGLNVVKEISFHSIILRGVEAMAKELGYNVLVSYFDHQKAGADQIAALGQDVEGVLILGTELGAPEAGCAAILNNLKCHVVVVDNNLMRDNVDCIVTDNLGGAYQAISYLRRLGHTRIGYLCSRQRIPNFDERGAGVDLAARRHPDVVVERIPVSFSTSKAYREVDEWLQKRKDVPTAFFADSDIIAFGAMQAFDRSGLRVPGDVSIVGFDDMPACEMVSPQLTSVRVMKTQTGRLAMQILHERITGERKSAYDGINVHIAVSTCIKERNSAAPLAPAEGEAR